MSSCFCFDGVPWETGTLLLLDLGLQQLMPQTLPAVALVAAVAVQPLPRSLPAALGVLLYVDGSHGSSDPAIRVGTCVCGLAKQLGT